MVFLVSLQDAQHSSKMALCFFEERLNDVFKIWTHMYVIGEFSKEEMKWKRLFFRFFPCLFFLAFVTYVVRGWSSFEVVWQRNKPRLSDTSPFDGFNAYKLHVLLCLNILLVKGLVKWFHCRPQNDIIILQLVLTGSRIVPSWKRINSLYSNSFCHYQMAYIN